MNASPSVVKGTLQIRLWTLEGLFEWNRKGLCKSEMVRGSSRRSDDEGRGQGCRRPLEAKKDEGMGFSPRVSRRN